MSEITKETIDEIVKRIDENVHDVKIQTTKTNGCVRDLQLWRARTNGALIVLSIIVTGIVIPLAFKYLEISLFSK
jgi:hypothetical protein